MIRSQRLQAMERDVRVPRWSEGLIHAFRIAPAESEWEMAKTEGHFSLLENPQRLLLNNETTQESAKRSERSENRVIS